jgi:hypothetical protein
MKPSLSVNDVTELAFLDTPNTWTNKIRDQDPRSNFMERDD